MMKRILTTAIGVLLLAGCHPGEGQWVERDKRWPPPGPWRWAVRDRLPELNTEFNGIDFGHAHLAETLIRTQDPDEIEQARQEVLAFIWSAPPVSPDEEQVGPTFARMAWEVQKTFDWTHILHRSLYDLFGSDVADKEAAYRRILENYLSKPEAITPHMLDHAGKLWSFPESKTFRDKFPQFNTQIWAYHWLQAAASDVQLMGDATKQRELFKPVIEHYHAYLRKPPVEWKMMPMFHEVAPEFTKRFPQAAAIFDNLHMLHDNVDDVLCRPDLYPNLKDKRQAILKIHAIYLHRNHGPDDTYAEYHGGEHGGHDKKEAPAPQGAPKENPHHEH